MKSKKILTFQDISCYGQCSITVALPVLSAWGIETAILPSAILSTHTAGFKDFVVHDLSDEIPHILAHWEREHIQYDALYAGYLGELRHFEQAKEIKRKLLSEGAPFVLDPVMGDAGKLYPAFDQTYVEGMKGLVKEADYLLPNLTEACLLTGLPYQETYDEAYIRKVIDGLRSLGAKTIVLTGVSYRKGMTGVAYFDEKGYRYFEHERIDRSYHGTGDIYSSTFLGALLSGKDGFEASKLAASFVVEAIKNTIGDESHPYGVKFEPLLVDFIQGARK